MKKNFPKSVLLAIPLVSFAMLIFAIYGCNSNSNHKNEKGISAIYNFSLSGKVQQADTGVSIADLKEKCLALLKKRIEATGYSYSLQPGADGTWTLTVNDIADTLDYWKMLTGTGYMEFRQTYHIDELATPLAQAYEKSKRILDSMAKREGRDSATGGLAGILVPPNSTGDRGPQRAEFGMVLNKDTALLNQLLQNKAIAHCFPADLEFLMGNKNSNENFQFVYATRITSPSLTNRDIRFAQPQADPLSNQMTVTFQFNDEAARRWYDMTENAALQGHKAIAMCLDKKVIYAPLVDEAIAAGNCRIVLGGYPGNEGLKHANLLSVILHGGILPMEVILNSQKFK